MPVVVNFNDTFDIIPFGEHVPVEFQKTELAKIRVARDGNGKIEGLRYFYIYSGDYCSDPSCPRYKAGELVTNGALRVTLSDKLQITFSAIGLLGASELNQGGEQLHLFHKGIRLNYCSSSSASAEFNPPYRLNGVSCGRKSEQPKSEELKFNEIYTLKLVDSTGRLSKTSIVNILLNADIVQPTNFFSVNDINNYYRLNLSDLKSLKQIKSPFVFNFRFKVSTTGSPVIEHLNELNQVIGELPVTRE